MGEVFTRFQTKTAQKHYPNGAVCNYIAYVREYPPPPTHTPQGTQRTLVVLWGDCQEALGGFGEQLISTFVLLTYSPPSNFKHVRS